MLPLHQPLSRPPLRTPAARLLQGMVAIRTAPSNATSAWTPPRMRWSVCVGISFGKHPLVLTLFRIWDWGTFILIIWSPVLGKGSRSQLNRVISLWSYFTCHVSCIWGNVIDAIFSFRSAILRCQDEWWDAMTWLSSNYSISHPLPSLSPCPSSWPCLHQVSQLIPHFFYTTTVMISCHLTLSQGIFYCFSECIMRS